VSRHDVLRKRKVLVVDDDVRNIFALTTVLENHEMDVVTATNGRQAIELIEQTPDLSVVLMDIMMPEMDGYETMRQIRRDPKLRTLPILGVDRQGHERGPREVPRGGRVRLRGQAGEYRAAAVAVAGVVVSLTMTTPTFVETEKASETPKVLIVDDQPRNLDALEAMLEPLGCVLVRAESADEALLSLLRHDFAAIVLDIRMPVMSGIELAKVIKRRKRSEHVPILFLTAHLVEEDDVLRGYGVGGVDYLSKPINAEILRSKVGVFVELFRKTRALAQLNETLESEIARRQEAQDALMRANEELETRVQERTAELLGLHRGAAESEMRLRLAIEVARTAAWELDLTSGRKAWSTDPETLFGFARGALGNDQRIARLVHPDDKTSVEQALARAFQTGRPAARNAAARCPRGAG
jgi:CheY-like chemotaxis protein